MDTFSLFILLALNPLNSLLSHPPRDFASLLSPPAVLQAMNAGTTDEALAAVLAAPADTAAPDLYVKKLMAIRLLEQNKSAKGLPALEATAKGADVTLRDAALEAIAAINGKPSPRPNGAALLKELARSVPADAGFVVVLDFERDSKATTLRAFLENALKEIEAKASPKPPANPNAPPDAATMMLQQFKQGLPMMIPQVEQGLVQALAATGNLRVDAVMIILPHELGTQRSANYYQCVAKGLYDPARIAALLESTGNFVKREIAGHVVYDQKQDQTGSFCLFDANTFLLAAMDDRSLKAKVMDNLISALTAAEKAPPQKALAEAFVLVTERQARLAVAGTFSPAQKKSFTADLMANVDPANRGQGWQAEEVVLNASLALLNFVQAEAYAATLDAQGKVAVQIVCADAAAATALNDSANKLQKTLLDIAAKQADKVPPQFAMLLADATKAGYLWKTEVADKTVTMKLDNVAMAMLGAYLGLEMPSAKEAVMNVHVQPPPPAALDAPAAPPPPPPMVEAIPAAPSDKFVWIPGRWGWGNGAYYWIPGRWAMPAPPAPK